MVLQQAHARLQLTKTFHSGLACSGAAHPSYSNTVTCGRCGSAEVSAGSPHSPRVRHCLALLLTTAVFCLFALSSLAAVAAPVTTPAVPVPAAPVAATPATAPAAPVAATPVANTPAAPATAAPVAATPVITPAAPVTKTPAAPVAKTPAVPVAAAPATQTPAAPVTGRTLLEVDEADSANHGGHGGYGGYGGGAWSTGKCHCCSSLLPLLLLPLLLLPKVHARFSEEEPTYGVPDGVCCNKSSAVTSCGLLSQCCPGTS
jgi:hypothetical protein